MRKQLSTTFSALDEITSTSPDPTPSLGSVLLRGDQSRVVESLLSRLATNPSSTASSSAAATSHLHAAPPAPHSYSDVATTMTGPPHPMPVPPQLQWAPAAAICYPYRSPPPQPHYYPPPQQYHYLYPNAAHLPPQHQQLQQPAQHPHHPQPQPQAVISSHLPPFVDGNLICVAPSHHVALQPQHMWRSTDAFSMATSAVGGTPSSSPSSPFASSPFTSSTSSLHPFSPGRSSSLDNVGDLGSINDSSAVIASFLAGDVSDDGPPAASALHKEKRRRLESGQRSTSPISDGRGLAAPYARRMAHGHGETGKRKTSDYTQQLQNVENDWFGTTESPDSAFFTGSTSSLPLQLFGATSSFSLSPPSAGAAVSSLPSPSSPPQHCLPTCDDPKSPCMAPSSLFFRHPDRNEAAEAGPTEEGWSSTNEDAGIRSCESVRPVLGGGQPPAASSP